MSFRPANALLALSLAAMVALATPGCGFLRRSPSPQPPAAGAPAFPPWPALTSTARPWAIWWWPGSAVDEKGIEAHLARYARAGLGGVHVVPIYGARGAENRFVPHLDQRWVQLLRFTVRAARAHQMGVDVSTGTGWPFGGPTVATSEGSRRAVVEELPLGRNGQLARPVASKERGAELRALMAVPPSGRTVDVFANLDPSTRRLDWTPPGAGWSLMAMFDAPTGMKVKRAAPGGEGLVLDQLSSVALPRYLATFDRAFVAEGPTGVRAFSSDSFEDMRSDFTDDLFAAFATRRGYDLRAHLPLLLGRGDREQVERLLADYRETISDLLLDRFVRPWSAWTHRQGALSRNQAHGSPGNLLDLYAASDIPETEAFGPSRLPIPGLHVEPNLPAHFGKPDTLFSKLASSAAHLVGRPLVSAESATWLGEHFQVAASQVKPELDRLFLAGVNHVFLHGVTYSPGDAPWPGWLFYASTDFGPESGFWPAMPALSTYVGRTQAMLQATTADRDLLLYFPMHDLWHQVDEVAPPEKPEGKGAGKGARKPEQRRLIHLTAHDVGQWLHQHPNGVGKMAQQLMATGVMFDFVSDRLLTELPAEGSREVILVPAVKRLPLPTWQRLRLLAEAGATVVFTGTELPRDVPGLFKVSQRQAELRAALAALGAGEALASAGRGAPAGRSWVVGRGRVVQVPDLRAALAVTGLEGEPLAARGLGLLRQRASDGRLYFLTNLGARSFEGWAALGTPADSAVIMDALTGQRGLAELRRQGGKTAGEDGDHDDEGSDGRPTEIFLRLPPGQSLLVRTFADRAPPPGPRWRWLLPTDEKVALPGPWKITFLRGGPTLPDPVTAGELGPWSALDDPAARAFAGVARYRTEVTLPRAPAEDEAVVLELGGVHATAGVRVNGKEAGIIWALPFHLDVTGQLRAGTNVIEIEVSSPPANRVAALARAGAPRTRYHDIDFVDIQYRPFDPRGWAPFPSGISGPAQLRYQRRR